jgi:hypothetical protein
MTILHKRKPSWARELIQDGEKYGVPQGCHDRGIPIHNEK